MKITLKKAYKTRNVIKSLMVGFIVFASQSCSDYGQISVKNETELMMENVKWGDVLISERILTNETSKPVSIKINKKQKKSNEIYFESTNDDYCIFAKTESKYTITENDLKVIRINNKIKMNINTKPR